MKNKHIAIIGGGNIGIAMADGLLRRADIPAANITVTRRRTELIQHIVKQGGNVTDNNQAAVQKADIVVLAVKPHQAQEILQQIASVLVETKHIVVSMVTGLSIAEMREYTGKKLAFFRAMPNTAMAMCESITCLSGSSLYANEADIVAALYNQVGKTVSINENLQEASTILGAAGIAFALRYIRAATQGGIEIGFSADVAQQIVAQTVKGAVTLLDERGSHPEREIDSVTTPRGVTISGLNEMEHRGFSSALIKGLVTSYNKIEAIKSQKK